MRKWLTLFNDNPNDVSVTTLKAVLSKRQPLGVVSQYYNSLEMTGPAIIGPNSDPAIALVTKNTSRALLVIQNDSFATVAGDVAPTMYFGFGISTPVGQGLGLPPGVGIVLDVRVPTNAIYVTLGPSINTGGSVVIQGIVQEGGVTNTQLDTANVSQTGQLSLINQQLAQLIALLTPKPPGQ